ncbi:50S ribosomal protein L21 [bacterium]|nr:50S ribosomal protein L21 [bacterium]|tara:strand:- start:21595 stop:21993 length:399 start_codon:yes stop_codon:yes gene_type:complete
MNFAVIETGGKQYVVAPGASLSVEKLPKAKEGGKITFDKVLLLSDGKSVKVGAPYVSGAKVEAEVTEMGRGKKVTVLKYKRKVRYRVKKGHRQPFTKIKVAGGKEAKPKTTTKKATTKKTTTKKTTKKVAKK